MAAELRPDPVGELKRSPHLLAAKRGPTSKGGEGRGKEGRREREGREGWRGRGEGRRRVGEGRERGREGKGPQEKFDKSNTSTDQSI